MTTVARFLVPLSFVIFSCLFIQSMWDLTYASTALPYLAIIVILLLSAALLFREVRDVVRGGEALEERGEVRLAEGTETSESRSFLEKYGPPAVTVIILAIYSFLAPLVGFYPTTLAFLLVMCLIIGVSIRNYPIAAVTMLLLTVASYLFFTRALEIQLP